MNDIGGFHCECPSGYNFSSNGRDCTGTYKKKTKKKEKKKENERKKEENKFKGPSSPNLYFIKDIDECKTQTSNCSEHAACSNSVGSFSCSCRSGYLGNGYLCLGILSLSIFLPSKIYISFYFAILIFSFFFFLFWRYK